MGLDTITIRLAEPPLRTGAALYGGLAIPANSLRNVFRRALAPGVHQAELSQHL